MTSNPHPEHGPLWTTRRDDDTVTVWTEDVDGDGYAIMIREGDKADAIEAQLTPLPDGVYRQGADLWIAPGFALPEGSWQWFDAAIDANWNTAYGSIVDNIDATRVRRVPAEPPAPPTEDVPWWEALRDERLLPGDLGTRCISTGFVGGRRWVGEGDAVGSYLNPDGTVTVQAQGVES